MRSLCAVAVFLFAACAWAQGPRETRDVVYSTTNGVESKLDVYQSAAATPAPVLIYFHGGSWTTGERPKSASSFRSFLKLGFSVVSVDYRLADVARAPAAVQDARCALAWVKANAGKFGFDLNRVVTHGTSAGGQLALVAAMLPPGNDIDLPSCRDVPKVAAVFDEYGPADVWAFARRSPRTRAWLGDSATGPEMARRLSPLALVRPGLPPTFITHGDADPTVAYDQSVALRDSLVKAGVPTRLFTVPGGLHGKFPDDQKQAIARELAAFLAQHGVLSPP